MTRPPAINGIADSIAGDLLRLALDADSGKLTHCGALAQAGRGALMIDLVRVGALWRDGESLGVDTTPTGFALADEVLAGVTAHPDLTLERWLQRGVPHLHEFVAEFIAEGLWSVERRGLVADHARFVDSGRADFDRLLGRLRDISRGAAEASDERQAALCLLAAIVGLLGAEAAAEASARETPAAGEFGWIVDDVVTYLDDAQRTDVAAGLAEGLTTGLQVGTSL